MLFANNRGRYTGKIRKTGRERMKAVQESAEHHFLSMLEKCRKDPECWFAMHFALSRKLDHENLVSDLKLIPRKLEDARKTSGAFFDELKEKAAVDDGVIYQFTDNDIVLLCQARTDGEKAYLETVYKEVSGQLRKDMHEMFPLATAMYNAQKLSDAKFLSAKRMNAYRLMTDNNKTGSISLRRKRREDPVVLIVEDDRFTASYAANILNKDYDMVHAKNGEEAITAHIENAPDIVFLDIHLPGISGHQTLKAIKQVDPEAFVIILSVDTGRTNVVSATKNGAHGFLKKPFSRERLLATVAKSPFVRRSKSESVSQTNFH